MKKAGANAKWHGLSPARLKTLESWLFEEKMNYDAVLERAKKELGFTGSLSSLKRFYQRRSQERLFEDFAAVEDEAQAIGIAPGGAKLLRAAGMKLISRVFMKKVMESPDEPKEWESLAKLLLASEEAESRRELRAEQNRIRREALEFARQRFEFDAMEEAQAALPELQARAKAEADANDPYAYNKQTNALRYQLWGKRDLPDILPENAEEEAAMAAAEEAKKAERRAELERQEMERRRAEAEHIIRVRAETEQRCQTEEAAAARRAEELAADLADERAKRKRASDEPKTLLEWAYKKGLVRKPFFLGP